eukprot:SAG25_NODE_11939_length_291_cov_1.338542_1_plen_61_part_10
MFIRCHLSVCVCVPVPGTEECARISEADFDSVPVAEAPYTRPNGKAGPATQPHIHGMFPCS